MQSKWTGVLSSLNQGVNLFVSQPLFTVYSYNKQVRPGLTSWLSSQMPKRQKKKDEGKELAMDDPAF